MKRIFVSVIFSLAMMFAVNVEAQEAVPSPTPQVEQSLAVPPIAPDFRPGQKPLPELGRVGVELDRQKPLSLREALGLALENNKDIEVARHNVKIAEFDLLGSRGAYDPRFSSSSYFERIESPISSFLSGGSNGSVIQNDYTGSARFEGLAPKFGGNYRLEFSSIRLTSNNQFAALNPQYPTALTLSYAQPLVRGLKFDNNRRLIEIAKRTCPFRMHNSGKGRLKRSQASSELTGTWCLGCAICRFSATPCAMLARNLNITSVWL